jgi:hypothetical protein
MEPSQPCIATAWRAVLPFCGDGAEGRWRSKDKAEASSNIKRAGAAARGPDALIARQSVTVMGRATNHNEVVGGPGTGVMGLCLLEWRAGCKAWGV